MGSHKWGQNKWSHKWNKWGQNKWGQTRQIFQFYSKSVSIFPTCSLNILKISASLTPKLTRRIPGFTAKTHKTRKSWQSGFASLQKPFWKTLRLRGIVTPSLQMWSRKKTGFYTLTEPRKRPSKILQAGRRNENCKNVYGTKYVLKILSKESRQS